jgi:hypothetical protein
MDPVLKKTQQLEFVSLVLPDLFHSLPDQFLFYLNRDGNKFLNFYWNEAAKKVEKSHQKAAFGLNYELHTPRPQVKVALIRLPAPLEAGEAHFVALCYRPTRVTPFLGIGDQTKLLVLEHSTEAATLLVELTRRLQRVVIGPGPEPRIEDFYQAVLGQLTD